jgi:hypothetical protein
MYRLVAIFFLLWTMTDLSVPQVCMADFDLWHSVAAHRMISRPWRRLRNLTTQQDLPAFLITTTIASAAVATLCPRRSLEWND